MRCMVLWWVVALLPTAFAVGQFTRYVGEDRYGRFRLEGTGSLAFMRASTDLNGNRLLSGSHLHSGSEFGVRIDWHKGLAFHLKHLRGWISGADSTSRRSGTSVDIGRKLRNLHFVSPLTEWSINIEFQPLRLCSKQVSSQPAAVVGFGMYQFRPKGFIDGQWVDLHSLRTEGQGLKGYSSPYKLRQNCILLGVGMRYQWNPSITTRIMAEHRILFNDHLDDVSTIYTDLELMRAQLDRQQMQQLNAWYAQTDQRLRRVGSARGNPGKNDAYTTVKISLEVVLWQR